MNTCASCGFAAKKEMVRTRFAPSPTGMLHVGGVRTALFNYLLARQQGGQFILRIEDTDEARNTTEARGAILDGLRWLGLDWDEGPLKNSDSCSCVGAHGPYYQSQRQHIYEAAFAELQSTGRVYEEEGAWRFAFERKKMVLEDMVCGTVELDFTQEEITPDMTIRRPDGSFIFHFVNVIDDLSMGITHVVRGEDHLTNTHKHLQLIEALGANAPQYAHIPLILNADGSKMSKRDQGAALASYHEEGFVAEGLVNYLALLGWHPGGEGEEAEREIFSLEELVARFDLSQVHRSNAAFDLDKCRWMSAQHLRRLSASELTERAKPWLEQAGVLPAQPETQVALAALSQERAEVLPDLVGLFAQAHEDEPQPSAELREKALGKDEVRTALAELAKALPSLAAWDEASIKEAIGEAAQAQGLKLGKLMFPLRVVVTGSNAGLDLLPLLELLGASRVAKRIEFVLANA